MTNLDELWQLYDEQGVALEDKGSAKDEVFSKGLLHGAAHVWIWRIKDGIPEVLLQKRAPNKRTWPNRYDISAAGHIDLGETPLDTALREANEEIGLNVTPDKLKHFGVHRAHLETENNQLVLKITDDGKGFDTGNAGQKKTLGLLGMKERTLMMGGSYEIKSQPGKGTTVTIAAPFISQHNLIPQ